jgi:hypothetical protein
MVERHDDHDGAAKRINGAEARGWPAHPFDRLSRASVALPFTLAKGSRTMRRPEGMDGNIPRVYPVGNRATYAGTAAGRVAWNGFSSALGP